MSLCCFSTHFSLSLFENSDDFYIFHAATVKEKNQVLSNGGRVLSIVSLKEEYIDCRKNVYEVAEKIDWDYKYFRLDIGSNY